MARMNVQTGILALFLVTSCGKKQDDEIIKGGSSSEKDFQIYLETFEEKMHLAGVDAPMNEVTAVFADSLPNNAIGTCQTKIKKITISREYWEAVSEAHREQLMYHELGHCVLGRGHLNDYVGDKPVSIMNAFHFPSVVYAENYGDLMNELFLKDLPELAALEFDPGPYASTVMALSIDEARSHDHGEIRCLIEDE